jgi:hypothetical protein
VFLLFFIFVPYIFQTLKLQMDLYFGQVRSESQETNSGCGRGISGSSRNGILMFTDPITPERSSLVIFGEYIRQLLITPNSQNT